MVENKPDKYGLSDELWEHLRSIFGSDERILVSVIRQFSGDMRRLRIRTRRQPYVYVSKGIGENTLRFSLGPEELGMLEEAGRKMADSEELKGRGISRRAGKSS